MTKDEALKLALEWFEKDGEPDHHPVVTAIREALAQPEQEPVAGQCRFPNVAWSPCAPEHVRMILENPHEWEGYEVRYLYTTPPQRKPLNMTEIVRLTYDIDEDKPATMAELFRFARAIEAAHGIKGEA